MNYQEKIRLAYTTNSLETLKQLMNDENAKVRRAVARNHNSSKDILDFLVFDPVMNVSFMAYSNPNSTKHRKFSEEVHPCVTCLEDETKLNCNSCKKIY